MKDRRGVEVTFESTLNNALNRGMKRFGFPPQSERSRIVVLSGAGEFGLGRFGQNLNGFERGGLNVLLSGILLLSFCQKDILATHSGIERPFCH